MIKLLLYLSGISMVAQVAADAGHEADLIVFAEHRLPNTSLAEKIAAFRKSGVEKEVNTTFYEIDSVIHFAESLVGTPHAMGGYSSSGLDCSGLIKLAHAAYGVDLPRSSHDQARYGKIIEPGDELRRGDLVFFHSTYKKNHLVTHAGIYIGGNQFIHASATRGVVISTLHDDGYYEQHYLFATRLIE